MAVTLSLFAGAGAQFFDNNGVPLVGGKIYTYAAGTTTPLQTYTTVNGNVFHTNPIVLDSAGRVPSGGEIWLAIGVGYKFVVKTSTEVLISTYDNIPSAAQPPAANDADSIMYEQGYIVTAGSFVVGKTYRIVSVGTTDFTLIGAATNTVGLHFIATGVGTGDGTAELSQTVEAKLRQIVSVKDFGAVGDGVTDDTNAILAAIAGMPSNGAGLTFPPGTYIVNSDNLNGLKFDGKSNFVVEGYGATVKVKNGATVTTNHEVMFFINCQNGAINGLTIDGNRANRTITVQTASHCLSITDYCSNIVVNDVTCKNSTCDGVYVSTTVLGTQASYPTDIVLNNVIADNSWRNGLSAIGSLRLTVNGGEYKNTNGNLPECGIDIEPDPGYTFGNQLTVINGSRFFGNSGYGLALGGPVGLNKNILLNGVTGGDNALGFLNVASCDNPVIQNVVAYDHPTATRGIIDIGTEITNPILDGASFIAVTASDPANVCVYLHGSITGIPIVRNINVEAASCPILYADVKSDINGVYGNFVPDNAIVLTLAYSSLKNVQLSNCSDRSIYVSGANVTLDGVHLVDCGAANSRAIQFEAANAIVRNVDILFTGARPANFVGILFNNGAPRLVMNVLAKAASSDFNYQSSMTFTSGVAGATIRNVSPSPFGVSQTWNPGSIADGASESVVVSVPGVIFGMVCYASLGISTSGLTLTAAVSQASPGQITATLTNNTGSPVDLASSTLTVWAELL